MKKILFLLAFVSSLAFGQSYPSPTYNHMTLQTPLAIASGGTNAASASGTALDNITGFASTGFLTRTGAGAYAFQSLTNGITYANLAQAGANTVLANATGSTANLAALTVPSCTTSASALIWTNGFGFGCNTNVNAATLMGSTWASPGTIGSTTPNTGAFTTLSATTANPTLSYNQGGTGAVARTYQSKFGDIESVLDFNAKCDGSTDDSTSFQNAANALPSTGGTIFVPSGTCVVNTAPTWGTKSIFWHFSPATVITGTQTTFPRMQTNSFQAAAGPWLVSQSAMASPASGGIGGFNVEMEQPSTYVGQSEAMYIGANGSSTNTGSNVWALNTLVQANSGAAGIYHSIEADVNSFSAAGSVYTVGVDVTGVGTSNANTALSVERADTTKWVTGLWLQNTLTGIKYGTPAAQSTPIFANVLQPANNADVMIFQRATDTSPGGNVIHVRNNANNTDEYLLDVNGDTVQAGTATVTGGIVGVTNASNPNAGIVGELLSNTTTGTSLSTGVSANATSVTLTAGDWDVSGSVFFNPAGTTTVSAIACGISTTSASLGALPNITFLNTTFATGVSEYISTPTVRINVSSSTTVYLVAQSTFGTSTMSVNGFIRARRVR